MKLKMTAAMELKETVPQMISEDYKERFKAEYRQTKIRYERLKAFNNKIEADKLAPLAQKHEELLLTLIRSIMAADKAYKTLESFASILTEDERDVLYARYRKGMSFRVMEDELHRCESTLKRIHKRIKIKFAKFEI